MVFKFIEMHYIWLKQLISTKLNSLSLLYFACCLLKNFAEWISDTSLKFSENIQGRDHKDSDTPGRTVWSLHVLAQTACKAAAAEVSCVCVTYIRIYWTASTLPNERTHSRKWFTVVAVTRSVVTVCVEPTIPYDDNEHMTFGKTQVSYEHVYKIAAVNYKRCCQRRSYLFTLLCPDPIGRRH